MRGRRRMRNCRRENCREKSPRVEKPHAVEKRCIVKKRRAVKKRRTVKKPQAYAWGWKEERYIQCPVAWAFACAGCSARKLFRLDRNSGFANAVKWFAPGITTIFR